MASNNREKIKEALGQEQPIEEDETENAETGGGKGKGGIENDKNSGLTIGDLDSANELIREVKDKKETAETETETETETDIIGEYQEVVGQFKDEFGGEFEDVPKDMQDDLGDAHKELQNLERKIKGLKTEKAKENAYKEAEQILQGLRAKIQETKDNGNKEKKHGTGTKAEKTEAKEGEKEPEKEKSEFEEKAEEEDIRTSQLYKSSIYNRFFDNEKFGLTKDIIESSQGILEEQMKDVLVEDAKNWLMERVEDNPDDYPALEGQNIDEFGESRIMDLIENEKGFWDQMNKENKEWQDIKNLRESIKYFGEKTPPDIKAALMKRMPSGSAREKLWEKITGESLDETAKDEAGIGEKEIYTADENRLTDAKNEIEFFVKNKLLGVPSEISYAEWKQELKNFDEKEKNIAMDKMEEQKEEQEKKMKAIKESIKKAYPKKMMTGEDKKILALMSEGYDIENIKLKGLFLKGLFSKKVELKKIDGTKEEKEYKEFLGFVDDKVKEYDTVLEKKAKKELGQEWTEKIDAKKNTIVEKETGKAPEEAIENCYQKMARDTAARFLEKTVNKDPKRKAKIEKEFGKGKRQEIQQNIGETLKTEEKLENNWEEDEEDVKEILETWGIDSKKLTEKQKHSYERYSEKKYGLIDWIFAIIFHEV